MSKAQQAVVTAHYGIARGMARSAFKRHVERWGNHAGSMGDNRGILLYDDFLSAACEGLCQAVRAFNPEYKSQDGSPRTFGTYCKRYVHGELSDLVRRHRFKELPSGVPQVRVTRDEETEIIWDDAVLPDGSHADGDPGESAPLEAERIQVAIEAAAKDGLAVCWPVREVADLMGQGVVRTTEIARALKRSAQDVDLAKDVLRKWLGAWKRS
jgi:hypothetical protein